MCVLCALKRGEGRVVGCRTDFILPVSFIHTKRERERESEVNDCTLSVLL